jgi:CRP-like cAMP-binding protein
VIFAEGDTSDSVFVIQTGVVQLSAKSPKGKNATLDILGEQDLVGKDSLRRSSQQTPPHHPEQPLLAEPRIRRSHSMVGRPVATFCYECQELFQAYSSASAAHHSLEFALRCYGQERNDLQMILLTPQVQNALRIRDKRKEALLRHRELVHGIQRQDAALPT